MDIPGTYQRCSESPETKNLKIPNVNRFSMIDSTFFFIWWLNIFSQAKDSCAIFNQSINERVRQPKVLRRFRFIHVKGRWTFSWRERKFHKSIWRSPKNNHKRTPAVHRPFTIHTMGIDQKKSHLIFLWRKHERRKIYFTILLSVKIDKIKFFFKNLTLREIIILRTERLDGKQLWWEIVFEVFKISMNRLKRSEVWKFLENSTSKIVSRKHSQSKLFSLKNWVKLF